MEKGSFSVLMSVYDKENPTYLDRSLDSIFSQTLLPSEVILLEDGPLTQSLYVVLDKYEKTYPELRRISFPLNRGLAPCLNDGLKFCSNDIVARMDSDDISMPQRFEKEYRWLTCHPDYAIVGSWIQEFETRPGDRHFIRRVPETSEDIESFAKRRNPMNHPTVMFRKKEVIKVGGYPVVTLFEDYALWIKMMRRGYRFYNLQEPLLWFRFAAGVIDRRGGWSYAKTEISLQKRLHNIGFISTLQMVENICVRCLTRLLPPLIRNVIYKFIRRC